MKKFLGFGLVLVLNGCGFQSTAPIPTQLVNNLSTNYTLLTTAANACVTSGLCKAQAAQIAALEAKWGPQIATLSTLTPPNTLAALTTDLQTLRALPGVGTAVPNPNQTQADLNSVLSTLLAVAQIAGAVAPLL